jgi:hypothetical protein
MVEMIFYDGEFRRQFGDSRLFSDLCALHIDLLFDDPTYKRTGTNSAYVFHSTKPCIMHDDEKILGEEVYFGFGIIIADKKIRQLYFDRFPVDAMNQTDLFGADQRVLRGPSVLRRKNRVRLPELESVLESIVRPFDWIGDTRDF